LSAYITDDGSVYGLTEPFQADVRVWRNDPADARDTFYTRHGDLFVCICAVVTAIIFVGTILDRIYKIFQD
jgi:apolipoprotein N-acyltransferase